MAEQHMHDSWASNAFVQHKAEKPVNLPVAENQSHPWQSCRAPVLLMYMVQAQVGTDTESISPKIPAGVAGAWIQAEGA
jgi:hypothetical protein